MNYPHVAIIILNWNGWEDTLECLESVFQINYTNYCVILVDNHSTDDSISKIVKYAQNQEKFNSKFFKYESTNKSLKFKPIAEYLRFIANPEIKLFVIQNNFNEGFSEGNNIGIRFAAANLNSKYYLLLNNDTIVKKDFLTQLVNEGEKDARIGMLGPKIYYYDKPNLIWCIGGKIDWNFARGIHIGTNEIDYGQYNEKASFDYISGAALLLKQEVLNNIGLLDKNLFLYFEETDLALRASSQGYKTLYVPKAEIWHKVSQSGGGLSKPIGLYYITRNRWLFIKKWANKKNYIIFVFYQLIGIIFIPLILSLYFKNHKLIKAYYSGFVDGIKYKSEN